MKVLSQELITTEEALEDGDLIAIIGVDNANKYYPLATTIIGADFSFNFQKKPIIKYDITSSIDLKNDSIVPYTYITSAIMHSTLFRVIRHGSKFILYDANAQHYLYNNGIKSILTDSPDKINDISGLEVCPNTDKSEVTHQWKYNGRWLTLEGDNYFMETSAELQKTGNCIPVKLYKVGKIRYNYTFDEEEDLNYVINYKEEIVSLYRKFKDNNLNTLSLPYDVPNYQKVFGFNTQVYKPVQFKDNTINFERISPDSIMKADSAYIITGNFFPPPYIIQSKNGYFFPHKGLKQEIVNGIFFWGVYSKADISGKDYCFISDNKLYLSKNFKKAIIKPYRWYFNYPNEQRAKQIYFDGFEISTNIAQVKIFEEDKDKAVYNIQGIKVADSLSKLKGKGLFIVNGKKIIR